MGKVALRGMVQGVGGISRKVSSLQENLPFMTNFLTGLKFNYFMVVYELNFVKYRWSILLCNALFLGGR